MYIYKNMLVYSANREYKYIFNKVATRKYDLLVFKDLSKLLINNTISKAMVKLLLDNCKSNSVDVVFIDRNKEYLLQELGGIDEIEVFYNRLYEG